jgi:hypothetical protein
VLHYIFPAAAHPRPDYVTFVPPAPGETLDVRFIINEANLAFTRAGGTRGVEPGRFQAWVAPDSAAGLKVEFVL